MANASSTPMPWDLSRQAATKDERPMPIRQWTATAFPAHSSFKIRSMVRPASGMEKGTLLSGIGNERKRRPQSPQSRSSSWSSSSATSSAVSSETTTLTPALARACNSSPSNRRHGGGHNADNSCPNTVDPEYFGTHGNGHRLGHTRLAVRCCIAPKSGQHSYRALIATFSPASPAISLYSGQGHLELPQAAGVPACEASQAK